MRCGRRGDLGDMSMFKIQLPESDEWRDHNGYPACSHCGSMSPDALFAAIEEGCELGPTDKSYKVYVDLPNKVHAKFYFQHFSEDEMGKFIKLMNAAKLNIGYPGYFYTMPFFITVSKP